LNSRTHLRRGPWIVAFAGLAGTLLLLTLGGCYERVIEARGLGADSIQTEEPYQESGEIDRWIFGDDPATKQRERRR